MKIAIATPRYPPASGGAEKYVERLATGLAAKGRDVRVFASDYEQHLRNIKLDPSVPRRESVGGVDVRRERSLTWRRYGYFVAPSMPFKIAASGCDVVYGLGFGYWPALAAKLASLTRRAPFVLQPNFPSVESPFYKAYLKYLGPLIKRADATIFYSRFELDLYLKSYREPKRFIIAPPGVDEIYLNASLKLDVLRELGVAGKKAILCVGRVDEGKRLDVVIDAAPAIVKAEPSAAFVFAGPDFGATAMLKDRASKKGVADNVVFTGSLPQEKLASLYRESAAFAHPSGFELFGIAVAEAFASGAPVVAASAGSVPELVEHEQTGLLVALGDHNAMADAIIKLLQNEGLRTKLVSAARDKALKLYNWNNTVDAIDRLFAEVVG